MTWQPPVADPWAPLRRHTPARIGLGRSGGSLPTGEVLRFAAAHAQARDAVQVALDAKLLAQQLVEQGFAPVTVQSQARQRDEYLRRPDLGRRLHPADALRVQAAAVSADSADLAVMLGDGLSALAVQRHALPVLLALRAALHDNANGHPCRWAPLVIATQARVALGDEVGALMQARVVLVLIGERPGLSAPDSLGAYLTFAPHIGRSDAERNCVSNIRPEGLPPTLAAARIGWLLNEALRRRVTGVALKDDSGTAVLPSA